MADIPITVPQMPPAGPLTGAEILYAIQNNVDVQTTLSAIISAVLAGADPAGTAATAVSGHLNAFAHGDIAHANRAALDLVSGVNTGDQDISGFAPINSPSFNGPVSAQSVIIEDVLTGAGGMHIHQLDTFNPNHPVTLLDALTAGSLIFTTAGSGGYESTVAMNPALISMYSLLGTIALSARAITFNGAGSGFVKFGAALGFGLVECTVNKLTLNDSHTSIIANYAGPVELDLPNPATFPGRIINVRTITANTVVAKTAVVTPLAGGAAGTAILAATAGKYAMLQSDGTNWQIMQAN